MVLSDAIINATKKGNVAAIEAYLGKGGDPNDRAPDRDVGCSLLNFAALHGEVGAIEALLGGGADVDMINAYAWTPLHTAAGNRQNAAVAALLKAGASPVSKTATGATPLMHAAIRGDVVSLRHLLKAGAPVEADAIKEAKFLEHFDAQKLLEDARQQARAR